MKTRNLMFVALAAMIFAPSAYGQYIQPQQPPVITPQQQNFNNTAYSNAPRQPIFQNAAFQRGQGGFNNGFGGGRAGFGGGSDGYNPCCPMKYFSVFGGGTNFQDISPNIFQSDVNGTNIIEPRLGVQDGWAAGGAIGRSFGRRLRGEMEFSYRNASFQSAGIAVNGIPQGALPLEGKINSYSFMPNLYFDVNPCGRFNMYVGGGGGVTFNDLDVVERNLLPLNLRLRNSTFAYQGILGISAKLNARTDLFIEYRYFGTDKLKIDAATVGNSLSTAVDITSNNYFIGLRVKRW